MTAVLMNGSVRGLELRGQMQGPSCGTPQFCLARSDLSVGACSVCLPLAYLGGQCIHLPPY